MALDGIWNGKHNSIFDHELKRLPNRTVETQDIRVVWFDSFGGDNIVFDLQVNFLRYDLPAFLIRKLLIIIYLLY